MSALNLIDRYGSTLSGPYTSGGGSLSVTSATGLPSGACNFQVIVKAEGANTDEVFNVTNVSGTTLTVTGAQAGSTASNHANGATIIGGIMTVAAFNQRRADNCQTGTDASKPAAANAGALYLPSNGVQIYRDSGSAQVPWGPMFQFTDPTLQTFAWINQGSATLTTTQGGINLSLPANASFGMAIRKKSAPTVPYVITAAILPGILGVNFQTAGLCFRESSSGKVHYWGLHWEGGWSFDSGKASTATSFSAHYGGFPSIPPFGSAVMWLRIADDNVNRTCSYSPDGQNWLQLDSHARTDFLTADEVGFAVNSQSAIPVSMTLLSWQES